MARVVVNYDVLSDIASYATKISKKADAYADDLTSKVLNKFGDISGGASSYTSDAKYYVKAKINALRDKQDAYASLATKITNFSEKAQRIDKEVEQAIARNQEKFLQKHEHLRIDEWKANLLNWLVDLKNSCPLFELVGNALRDLGTAMSDMFANLKHWYECEGGKQIVKVVAAIGGAILAVALFIASFPVSGFVALCGVIGAAIGLINAITNVVTSFQALHAAKNGDPAWAKIYGDRDKLSDVWRQTNYDNAVLNRLSYIGAASLDTIELFCDIVSFVDFGKKVMGKIRKPNPIANYFGKDTGLMSYCKEAKYQEVLDYDIMGKPCGTKWTMVVNEHGVVQTRFTPKSIARGIKAYIMDKPIDCRSGEGIRTVLNKNFSIDFKDFRKSFSIKGIKETFKYNVTDGSRVTYADWKKSFSFQGIKDTIRYNYKNSPLKGIFTEGVDWTHKKDYLKTTVKTGKNIIKYGEAIFEGNVGETFFGDLKNGFLTKSDQYNTITKLQKLFEKGGAIKTNYGEAFGAMIQ